MKVIFNKFLKGIEDPCGESPFNSLKELRIHQRKIMMEYGHATNKIKSDLITVSHANTLYDKK